MTRRESIITGSEKVGTYDIPDSDESDPGDWHHAPAAVAAAPAVVLVAAADKQPASKCRQGMRWQHQMVQSLVSLAVTSSTGGKSILQDSHKHGHCCITTAVCLGQPF